MTARRITITNSSEFESDDLAISALIDGTTQQVNLAVGDKREFDFHTPGTINVTPILKVNETHLEDVLKMDMPESVRSALKSLFLRGRNTSDDNEALPLVRSA